MKKSLLFFVTFISLSITAKIQNSLFSVEDNYLSGHDIVYLELLLSDKTGKILFSVCNLL